MTRSAQDVEIFFAALNLPDLAERSAYLDQACAGSPALRSWIEGELQRQLAPGGPTTRPGTTTLEAGAEGDALTLIPGAENFGAGFRSEEAGERIGAYTLVQRLGEGGFGTVWKAEQSQPVRRQVALKIIRVGANSRETLARFAQERQALALMDHPNIAKVFDAGATPTGRPFFVMELVRGSTITEYCDGFRLPVPKRLALFIEVCHAVQHAHQKGIIHRDLKPSNVLVTRREGDGVAVPKVIDFGIAKALASSGPLTEMTLATMAGGMLGTPLYMSPEQAASALDVDTRSDVYSLGVLLHHLLIGCTPLNAKAVEACRDYEEMRRLVLDAEPRRLTVRLRELPAADGETAARERGSEPGELARTLRGDLEWIVLRALEKDRDRRYASAQELAADLGRFLTDEPVVARPPSAGYRLGKLWRRNRATLTAAGAVAAAVLVGTVVSVQQAVRARAAEVQARTAQVEEAAQRQRAEAGQAAARQSEYVADVGLAQQSLAGNNLARAVALLDRHRPGGAAGPGASGDGTQDPRGFAWRYLWGLCRGEDGGVLADVGSPTDAVAFSPDGGLLAVAGFSGVTLCDARTRAVVAHLATPNVRSLVFLRDGQTLVTQSGNTLRLWRTADWTEAAAWTEGRGALALSADGTRLALVGAGGVVVRDTATWRETAQLPGAAAPMAFSPDGRTLATSGPGGNVCLWPLPESAGSRGPAGAPRVLAGSAGVFAPEPIAFFEISQGLSFSADGTALFVVENELSERGTFLLSAWDVRSGQRTATVPDDPARPEHTGVITTLSASPHGRLLATASFDHSVRLWDMARRRCVATFQGHRAEVGGVTFSPDGLTLASCDRLGQVRTWDARSKQSEQVVPEAVFPLGFADEGRTLVARTNRGTVARFDVATLQPRSDAPEIVLEPVLPVLVAVSGDGRTVAQGLPDGRVRIWRDADGPDAPPRFVTPMAGDHCPVETVALTPNGNTLLAGTRGEPWHELDLQTGGVRTLPFGGGRVVLSADGRRLIALPTAPTAAVEGAPLLDMGVAAMPGSNPTRKPEDGAVVVWDLVSQTPLARLPVARAAVFDAALSADGSRVATVGSDGIIRLWDAATGAAGPVCTGHKQLVHHLAFANDGKTLASSSDDGTVRLWNVLTGQELISIQHLGGRMTALRFSPDDRTLAVSRVNGEQFLGTTLHHAPSFAETDR